MKINPKWPRDRAPPMSVTCRLGSDRAIAADLGPARNGELAIGALAPREVGMLGIGEQRIGTVDTWTLHHFRWPILRVFSRHAVDQIELGHYVKRVLSTGRWESIRIVPHSDGDGHLSDHVYDVYGRLRQPVR